MALSNKAQERLEKALARKDVANEIIKAIDTSSAVVPLLSTTVAINWYVDPNGDDNFGTGDFTKPFQTIQKAIDSIPKRIRHNVTINLKPGTYSTGAYMNGFQFDPIDLTGGANLVITGTMVNDTIATGHVTGNVGSATAGAYQATSWATMTPSPSPTWTINNLKGRFVSITSGTGAGQIFPIASNTATALTICGPWSVTPDNTSRFAIVKPAAIITGGILPPPPIPNYWTFTSPGSFIIENAGTFRSANDWAISFNNIFFNLSPGTNPFYGFDGSAFVVNNCLEKNGDAFVVAGNFTNVMLQSCSMISSSDGAGLVSQMDLQGIHVFSFDNYCDFTGGDATGVFLSNGSIISQGNLYNGAFTFMGLGHVTGSYSIGDLYSNNSSSAIGFVIGPASLLAPGGDFVVRGALFNSNGTAVSASGSHTRVEFVSPGSTGTGNTTGISLVDGALAVTVSDLNIASVTNISVDGDTSTYTAYRALTPKVILSPLTGARIYEH